YRPGLAWPDSLQPALERVGQRATSPAAAAVVAVEKERAGTVAERRADYPCLSPAAFDSALARENRRGHREPLPMAALVKTEKEPRRRDERSRAGSEQRLIAGVEPRRYPYPLPASPAVVGAKEPRASGRGGRFAVGDDAVACIAEGRESDI